MSKKDSFIMYHEWWNGIKEMDDVQKGQFLSAVYAHELEGQSYSGDDPLVRMMTSFVFPALDRNRKKYEKICEERSKAGKQGGAKKGNQNARKQPDARPVKQQQAKQANARFDRQQQAKQPDYDHDHEHDCEYEYECDCDSASDETTPETTEPEDTETVSLELSGVVAKLKPYCRSRGWARNSTIRVQQWLERGAEPEMLVYAFDVAKDEEAENVFGYASAIIDRWLSNNVRTKNEAIECDRKWNELDSETRRRLTSDHTRTFFPYDEESSELLS